MMEQQLIRPDLRMASKSANLELNEKVKTMQRQGQDIYHLAFGQSPFPIPDVFVKGLQEYAGRHEYLPVAGIAELRTAIAKLHGFDAISPEQIIVGTGSKELIFLAMNIFHGDIILVSPGWTTYAPQVRLAKQRSFVVNTSMETQWKVTPQALTELVDLNPDMSSYKLLILNNPGNPSGTVYTAEELKALAVICRQKQIIVLSDEIYSLLNFNGNHSSLLDFYPEGTLVTSGFSKWSSAGGWRIGYIIIPKELNTMNRILQSAASQTYSCAPAPMQYAIAQGLCTQTDELEDYVQMERKILKAVGDYCASQLASVGVTGIPSQGGYYFMPDFEVCRASMSKRGILNGKQMCEAILKEHQVALLPGSDFLREDEELTVRLCFVDFDGLFAMQMVGNYGVLDEHFVQRAAPKVVEGIQRLKSFVQKHT